MYPNSSEIVGVSFFDLKQISDDRGSVLHMLRNDAGDFTKFGECYFSEINPGAVKAWKMHSRQTQNISVPIGRIQLVIFDDRTDSLTYGNLLVNELGRPDAYKRVKIPPRLWYGFKCISDIPSLLVNCADEVHSPGESIIMDIQNNSFPFKWSNASK